MKRVIIVVLVCLLAGCSSKAASQVPATSAATSVGSGPDRSGASDLPGAAPSAVTQAAADAKESCGAFGDLIKALGSSPPALNIAVTAASTMTTSGLAAGSHDPAHWQTLSDDIGTLLKSLTAGGTIKPPAANDPAVLAVGAACR